nr:YCF48-related protein [Geitlerinema sp. P-1104]
MTTEDGLDKDRQADELEEPHFYTLHTSPAALAQGSIFIGGFNGLYRSDNGGQQWQNLETLSPNIVTAFAISPNYAQDQTLAIGTYVNGIYLTDDGGQNWVRPSRGLHLPWFTNIFEEQYQEPRRYFHVAFSPNYAQDQTLFLSILWTKVLRSTDAGESWEVISLPSETRGVTILVSPNFAEDQTVYVAGQRGEFFRSEDGGRHFQEVADLGVPGGNDAPSLVASPNFLEDGILLATGPGGIYKSSDRAETWDHLTPDAAWETRRNLQIAMSPNYGEDQTIFVGTNGGAFWSSDGGASWDLLPGLADLADGYIEAIAVSPEFARDQTLMATIRGQGLWRSTDGGQSFSQTGDNQLLFSKIDRIPSAGMAIQFSPNYDQDNTLYAMGDTTTTLYRSTDQGTSWETLRVPDLALADPTPGEQVQIYFHVYRGRILRFGLAAFLGLVSYGVLSWFTRRRSLPIPRPVLPVIGTVVVFSGSLVILLN